MLRIIKRVLRLSGDLSGRIWGSFVCGFLDPCLACCDWRCVFRFESITERPWITAILGVLSLADNWWTLSAHYFQYLVYRLQSTAGFEFVARERIALGDRLRNVPMGFFHDHSMGELTATMTTDLNFLENYSMHILDKVPPAFEHDRYGGLCPGI